MDDFFDNGFQLVRTETEKCNPACPSVKSGDVPLENECANVAVRTKYKCYELPCT